MVVRVDEDKGFIDLSRKKVKPEDAAEHDQYYKKASLVHRILKELKTGGYISIEGKHITIEKKLPAGW